MSQLLMAVAGLAGIVLSCPVWGDFSLDLATQNTMPSYCQQHLTWCGAAVGEMVLEGYPAGIEHPFTQTYIWGKIQTHKDDSAARTSWATDPDALRDTLQELGGDMGVTWKSISDTSAKAITYKILYLMAEGQFPSAS